MKIASLATFASLICWSAAPALAAEPGEVNIYTSREPGLIQPLLQEFTKETGIRVNTVFVKEGLAQRVAAEGENSPADLLSVVDYGNLMEFVDRGLTQPVHQEELDDAVPANLRDKDGQWFAFSMRARVIYVSKDRVDATAMTYEDLADPKWKGKVCIRSGQHPYNTSLIAAMIAKDGEDATRTWLEGVKANLARTPGGGDRDVARDILAGICDVGVGNSYYVGLMRSGAGGEEQKAWGNAIRVILPTFKDGLGTHVNVSGIAMAKHAPNRENALALLDFMASDEAQKLYAESNFEYPVKPGAPVDPLIAELGDLKIDPLPLTDIGAHRKDASLMVDEVGFDN
ncbi:Iron uptake protein A2 [Hartmannibacter diazotrophicus]|uniref:Iron uptake protein A2 n=2 Tax=Hartmannibacter diazotrophicus TaxID=1482074 RepID=A0A2C9D2J3_9HYPH|nr:Iron uptake protein A2 [Hartmannibacter diazotrophicus]